MVGGDVLRDRRIEFTYIHDAEERRWIKEQFEVSKSHPGLKNEEKIHVLRQLLRAEMFETFLHKRYRGQKRFSLEGGESPSR